MTAPREEVFKAVRALMDKVVWQRGSKQRVFVTKSRRVRLFSDVSSHEQPSCMQAEHKETSGQVTGMPYKRVWEINWIIYQDRGGPGKEEAGTVENNLILDAIDVALRPTPVDPGFRDKRNTLGGLVHHCFIDGQIFKDPGDIDSQGMLVVPIKLLMP